MFLPESLPPACIEELDGVEEGTSPGVPLWAQDTGHGRLEQGVILATLLPCGTCAKGLHGSPLKIPLLRIVLNDALILCDAIECSLYIARNCY